MGRHVRMLTDFEEQQLPSSKVAPSSRRAASRLSSEAGRQTLPAAGRREPVA